MHNKTLGHTLLACILTCMVIFSGGVSASDHDSFVVFGDSLSDPGNAFALSGEQSVPPYETLDMFLVPWRLTRKVVTTSATAPPGSSNSDRRSRSSGAPVLHGGCPVSFQTMR